MVDLDERARERENVMSRSAEQNEDDGVTTEEPRD